MKHVFIFLGVFFILGYNSFAQKFTATVSSNSVSVGERIQVSFTLENSNGRGFSAPSFNGFRVLNGPNQMQHTQLINGRMSSSISITYLLQADMEGKFTIEPASINVEGKKLTSNPITITVGKAKPGAQNQSKGTEQSLDKQAHDLIGKNLFIRLSINKTNVYMGEQLTAVYKLYIHPDLNIIQYREPKMAEFNGFWASEFDIKDNTFDRETINGIPFKVAELKRVVLLPQQSGVLKIDPVEMQFVVRLTIPRQKRSRSMWDDFFDDPFGSYKDFEYTAHSNSSSVNVKPLPTGQPSDFNGGVGNLKLNAWLDKPRTKTNEPVTLKVQISGTGNLNLIEPFDIKLPPDIETYDPKIVDNVSVTESGISGNKIFEYLLIPRHSGDYRIQPVSFSYFNLDTKNYVTLTSDEFVLKVDKGIGGDGGTASGVNKEDIKYLNRDIRFIKTNSPGFSRGNDGFFLSGLFYAFSIFPLFLFILFFIYRRKQQELNENQVLLWNKRANSVAKKRLAHAKKHMEQGQRDKFHEEISHALWGYLSHKLSIPNADLTKDRAAAELAKKNVPAEIIKKLLGAIDYSEFARFAPAADTGEMNIVYNDAVIAITDMEGCLR